jgi:hypothetical protein
MQFPIHARPSDEIGQLALLTLASGIADPNYPVDNLTSLFPDDAFLTSSDSTAVDIIWDHGMATDVKLFSLHHHNIPAGTDVRIQRNATNSWGAPTMDVPVEIVAYPQTGLPFPVGVDLTAAAGYDIGGFQHTRLHIPSLAQLVGLGSALLWNAKRTAWDPVLPPAVYGEQQAATTFRTSLGRLRGYFKGVRLRDYPFKTRQEDAGWAEFVALFRECSSVLPFLWWRDPTHDSDAQLVAFDKDTIQYERPVEGGDYNVSEVAGQFNEMGNGVALPTTAEVAT